MKIKKAPGPPEKIKMKTKSTQDSQGGTAMLAEWWKAEDDAQLAAELCGTAAYLKRNQEYRLRQIAANVRLYSGLSVYNYAGSSVSKMDKTKTLPDDRPTFNLIQACVDTQCARLSQDEPQPKFLTDGGDYRERHLAQEMNQFILGEFDQVKAYEKGPKILRDGEVCGSGALKVYEDESTARVAVDRVMITDLYVDDNDALNGQPQSLVQLKLVDRDRFGANHPKQKAIVGRTPASRPDNSPDSGQTVTDQIMVVEGWRLPQGNPDEPGYIPGRHTLATMGGMIFDEVWEKPRFPFVFFHYSDPFLGFWGQGLATQLFGTQLALNRILYTIARAITLVGVPRVFIDQSSKVVKAHNNNDIGVLITYSGTKPSYEVAPCNAPELYRERDKLIEYGFKQSGISDMQATGEKPADLASGEAMRTYDDINSDRSAWVAKKYRNLYIDLAYLVTDVAMDICKRDGKYQTVYPNKDGTKEIDLPAMSILKNRFVIQCFTESMLPRQPAGRISTVTEMVQSGMLSIKEGQRLMRFPDTEQYQKLATASEERVFKILDAIVQDGKYTPPDPFMDLDQALQMVVAYINLYLACGLEEKKADLLRKFFKQLNALKTAGTAPPAAGPAQPTANPEPAPTSPLVPNTPQAQAA